MGYIGTATDLTLPTSCNGYKYEIYKYAFYKRNDITSITISESATSIGRSAFEGCDCLTSITIPASVTNIGEYAFSNCESLTSITIPEGIANLGIYEFSDCLKLIEVHNLSSLNIAAGSKAYGYVGRYAKNVYTATTGESKLFTDSDGYLFYDDGASRCLMDYTGTATELILPASCNGYNYEIYTNAFYKRNDITSITIPASVTSIDYGAFYKCISLVSVTFAENSQLTSIGSSAFEYCTSLASIEIPASMTSIGDDAFGYCTSLASIKIPASVTSVGSYAFRYCTSLASVMFANKNGWVAKCVRSPYNEVALSATDLAYKSTAATYLTSTYDDYYWKRS